MKRRLLAGILSLVMVLSLLPTAWAENEEDAAAPYSTETQLSGSCGATGEDNVTWALTQNNEGSDIPTYTLTISGTGAMADAAPWKTALSQIENATYTGKTTSGDSSRARTFYRISKIVVGKGVTSIGNNAFSFTDASEVQLPSTLKTIGNYVFLWMLKLETLTIPASVENLFYTVKDGEYTYYNTFDGAFNLKEIKIDGPSEGYDVVNGTLIGKLPDNGGWTIINCPDAMDATALKITDDRITSVGITAFSGCRNLQTIELPDTITTVGAGAFNKCYALTEFTVPAGVTMFEGNFRGCSSLKAVNWNNVAEIAATNVFGSFWADEADGAEHKCSVETTDLSKVTTIRAMAFSDSELKSATFSDSSELTINSMAFANCESWEMNDLDFSGAKYVAFDAFDGSNVSSVIYPAAQTEGAEVLLIRGQRTFYMNTFDSAMDSAKDGDTVKLLKDVKFAQTRSIAAGKEITLDLNDHVLRFTGSGRLFTVFGTLNVQDSNPTTERSFKVNTDGLWVLTDEENGNKTLTGGVMTGGNHTASGGAIMVAESGCANIISGNIVGNQSTSACGGVASTGQNAKIYITGGSIMGNKGSSGLADMSGNLCISGGTFTTPVKADWCDVGLYPKDNSDGTYTVSEEMSGVVAKIGDTYYSSIQEALRAANGQTGETTVTLLADTKMSGAWTPAANTKTTLDLNGYVLTAAEGNRLITVTNQNSEVNIRDSRPDAEHHYKENKNGLWVLSDSDSDPIIYGGIMTGGVCSNNGGAIVINESSGNATVNIYGGAIMGNITHVSNGAGGVNVAKGKFTMSGGYIVGNIWSKDDKTGVKDVIGGTITGGTFTTDISSYVASGYTAKQDATNKLWTVYKTEDGYSALPIPDHTYTGKAITPNVVIVDTDGNTITPNETQYTNNTNVSTDDSKAAVTVKINDNTTLTLNFNIVKDMYPTVSMADKQTTYDGNEHSLTATAKTSKGITIGNPGITIKYYKNRACTEEAENHTDAGTYYVKATLTETDNYASASAVAKLVINKADFAVTAEGYSDTYDGEPHSIAVTADDSTTVTYSKDGMNYGDENPAFTNVGEYTVYYKAVKTNYNDVTGSMTVKISPAVLTAAYVSETIRYGATPALKVDVTGFVNGETAETAAGYTIPTVANSNTAVGEYTLTPAGGSAKNYTFDYVSGTLRIYVPSAPGSSVTVPATANGSVTVSPSTASKGTTVTVTTKPNEGYELGSLEVLDKNGNALALKDLGNGKYSFTMPDGKVTVNANFVKASVSTGFADVPANAYYADAVKWAVDKGVTNGLSDTLFGPYEPCTRAQIVTFLWRAAGSPEPKSTASKMTDLDPNAYYYKAVLWAIENGITAGMTDTTFAPNATCTRGQSVTFLYRALGKKASGSANFSDVAANAFYADAVNWAVENSVTNGTSATTFSPSADCTRAEIVTFLYRAYQGK